MTVETVVSIIDSHRQELGPFNVKSLSIFGSVARGEDHPDSDVDILVEFLQPVGFFEFVRLKAFLEDLLSRKVDLVTPDALRPAMRDRVFKEMIRAA